MFKLPGCIIFIIVISITYGCHQDATAVTEPNIEEAGTPVTVTTISIDTLTETVELNATSVFQLKTFIKANTTGYLQSVNTQIGKFISKGQEIFTIKTKEAAALGNTINVLDTSFRFSGVLHIKSPGSGYVTSLNYKAGDYVQDGEQLATISEKSSFVFLMDLPYELTPYLRDNKNVLLKLPDGSQLTGYVSSLMPTVDPVSQTQNIAIKANTNQSIPEGLIAKAVLVKKSKANVVSLPKEAVLTDETQGAFWVMKMIDSVTAVRIPVTKGLENNKAVEILSPLFSPIDKIVLTGNYGLSDTAKVSIVQQ